MTGITLCDCFPQQYADLADVSASHDAERVRTVLCLEYTLLKRKDYTKGTNEEDTCEAQIPCI